MTDTQETIADIAAEKRRIAKEVRDYVSNGDYWDKKKANETAEDLEEEADRLEAAWKRERAKIEADALAVGGIVEAAHRRELSKNASKNEANFGQLSDCAKLREVCEKMLDLLTAEGFEDGGMSIELDEEQVIMWRNRFRAAISAPPRNCDVGDAADKEGGVR